MKRTLNLLCCAMLAIGSPANLLLATDYYVDASAPAGGDGSAATPWTTITEAMNSGGFVAGDVVHVASGTYDTALGESFPINIDAPIEFEGPGDLSAVLERDSNDYIFTIDTLSGTTTINGLVLANSSSMAGTQHMIDLDMAFTTTGFMDVRIVNNKFEGLDISGRAIYGDLPHELIVENNQVDGRLMFMWGDDEYAHTRTSRVVGNTVVCPNTTGPLIDFNLRDSGSYDLLIQNNTLTAGRAGINVDVEMESDSATMTVNAIIDGNTIADTDNDGIWVTLEMTDSSEMVLNADFEITNNTITNSGDDGIEFSIELTDSSELTCNADVLVQGNTVSDSDWNGLEFEFDVDDTTNILYANITVDSNSFDNNGGDGINFDLYADFFSTNVILDADVLISNNSLTGNGSDAVNLSLEHTDTSGEAHYDFTFRGNTMTGNGDSGIWMSLDYSNLDNASSVDLNLDFGTTTDAGNNTIHSNLGSYSGTSHSGDSDGIYLDSVGASSGYLKTVVIPAYGNTWGSGSIEDNIYHQVDDAMLPLVEFETGPPQAPVAVYDLVTAAEETAVIIHVTANDTDINGDLDENSVVITQAPDHGSITVLADGKVEYTPDAGWLGDDTFNYTVADTTGLVSNIATVDVATVGGNSMPGAVYDQSTTGIADPVTIDVLANDTDPEGDALDPASVVIEQAPHKGTVAVNADGTVTYTPDASTQFMIETTDTFNYSMADVRGARSNIATVEVTITLSTAAGMGGGAELSIMELTAGGKAKLEVKQATPGADIRFAYSNKYGVSMTRYGMLELAGNMKQLGTVAANANGRAVLEVDIPANGLGKTFWFQALDLGSNHLSKAVSGTVQ